MKKAKRLFTNWRFLLLVFCLVIFTGFLSPDIFNLNEGVAIRNVVSNSTAWDAGIRPPAPNTEPMARDVITEINGQVIKGVDDYEMIISSLDVNDTVRMKISSQSFVMKVRPEYKITKLNETVKEVTEKIVQENVTINGSVVLVNRTVDVVREVPKIQKEIIGKEPLGLDVYNAPRTNLRMGLDLQGGTRVLLEPETEVPESDIEIIISNLRQRLNVYGLSDIVIRPVQRGLFDKTLIMVEVAGANENEVRDLIGNQGKFEAKIGNETIFLGGEDITNVCRMAECSSAVDPRSPCGRMSDGTWQCQFYFTISLSPQAAQKQASVTQDLEIITENGDSYLSESLQLYLDDELMDELRISADLKGKATQTIAITGPGVGQTQQEAVTDSANNMKKLQTMLITGSLPVKLEIVKVDSVSPILGEQFLKNAIYVGIAAILSVAAVIFIRYRSLKVALPVVFTMASEVILILGFAAGIGWNLDLAAIAGIIIAVGTGVDDQIVILDETISNRKSGATWKERLKRAFFIIFAAFFTTLAAMSVLFVSGAGLLRGFALTTMIGIVVGVLVARPAFAAIVEILMSDSK